MKVIMEGWRKIIRNILICIYKIYAYRILTYIYVIYMEYVVCKYKYM